MSSELRKWQLYAVAATLSFCLIPFSAINIMPINWRMIYLAEKTEGEGKTQNALNKRDAGEVKRLVDRGTTFIHVRYLFPLSEFIVALYASMK